MATKTANATCPTCNTLFTDLPFEVDECGGFAVLEVTFCADRNCGASLCECCARFHCDGCGDHFCTSHLVVVPDGTPKPLLCCEACAAMAEPLQLPLPMGPGRETRIAAVAGHVGVA